MRAVNIVGYKDTGKTTLCVKLLAALAAKGVDAASLKFTHQAGLDKSGTDTAALLEVCHAAGAVGHAESAVFWRGARPLQDILPLLGRGMVIVEGGKELGVMPRVVIARDGAQARELGAGKGGLALAVYGPEGVDHTPALTDMEALVTLVLERSFLLPGLDCAGCGRPDCRSLASAIVAGEASAQECVALGGALTIEVAGTPLAINPFVERILRAGIRGMLEQLKGYVPGETVIKLT